MTDFTKIKKVLKFSAYACLFTLLICPSVYSFQIKNERAKNSCSKTKTAKKNKTNSSRKKKKGADKKMENTDLLPISPSVWGAQGINLTISDKGANVEYDCAVGEIKEKILIDAQGNFSVTGSYTPLSGGPVHIDKPDPVHSVRFEGKIDDNKMTLKVISLNEEEVFQKNILEKDKWGRIFQCN